MPHKDPAARRAYHRQYNNKYNQQPHVKKKRLKRIKAWKKRNPEAVSRQNAKSAPKKRERIKARRRERRAQVIALLGGKCSSHSCRWLNTDGTLGCKDPRLLQVDHKHGGGTQERNKLSYDVMLRRILLGETKPYQLLCAACNWLKAHTNKEFSSMEGKRKCDF